MTGGVCGWVRANEHALCGVCVALIAAFGISVPLLGWPVGWGAVAGGLLLVAVLAASNAAERREHDARVRELLRRPT